MAIYEKTDYSEYNNKMMNIIEENHYNSEWYRRFEGQTFGNLRIDKYLGFSSKSPHTHYVMTTCLLCESKKIINLTTVRNQIALSCGCLGRQRRLEGSTKHGLSHSRLYKIYHGMKKRCYNMNCKAYQDYGARGIKLCPEWENEDSGFNAFYTWAMSNGYTDDLTIERKDNNKDYCPENCHWISRNDQPLNRRNTHWIAYNGYEFPLQVWSKITGLNKGTLQMRIRLGWTTEQMLRTPAGQNKNSKDYLVWNISPEFMRYEKRAVEGTSPDKAVGVNG